MLPCIHAMYIMCAHDSVHVMSIHEHTCAHIHTHVLTHTDIDTHIYCKYKKHKYGRHDSFGALSVLIIYKSFLFCK